MTGRLLLVGDAQLVLYRAVHALNAPTMGGLCPVVIHPHSLGSEFCASSGEDRPTRTA